MAGFNIVIVGDKRVASKLSGFDSDLHHRLLLADHEAAALLEGSARAHAPQPKSQTEVKGHGIFSEVKSLFRLAGRAPGGTQFLTHETHFVELGIRDGSVAAYVEGGTGIYARPERGGPFSPWREQITARGKALAFPGRPIDFAQGGTSGTPGFILRKSTDVLIQGAHPHPFLAESALAVKDEVDQLYDHAVGEAVQDAN